MPCRRVRGCGPAPAGTDTIDTGLAKSGISEILAGKKPFSKTMIGVLAAYFHVPASVLAANIGKK